MNIYRVYTVFSAGKSPNLRCIYTVLANSIDVTCACTRHKHTNSHRHAPTKTHTHTPHNHTNTHMFTHTHTHTITQTHMFTHTDTASVNSAAYVIDTAPPPPRPAPLHSLLLRKEQPTYASGNHRAIIGKLGTHDIIPDVPIGARVGLFWKASHAI
jgi:hypothetical protein